MRIVVDLPAPLGPKKPNDSPLATSKSIPSTAMKSPYVFVSPRATINFSDTSNYIEYPENLVIGGADT
jgi:hypothetical protein